MCMKVDEDMSNFDTTYIRNGHEYEDGTKPKTYSDRGRQTGINNSIRRQQSEGSVTSVKSDLTDTDDSQMSIIISICPICCKNVGSTGDMCDGTVNSDERKNSSRFIRREVYGFPDQFRSKLVDNISYLVMMAIVNLNYDLYH